MWSCFFHDVETKHAFCPKRPVVPRLSGHNNFTGLFMPLGDNLIKKLAKQYAADAMIDFRYAGKDLTIKTDAAGNAILLFIGRRIENGHIRGERYARRLLFDAAGKNLKDHWEAKGKSS